MKLTALLALIMLAGCSMETAVQKRYNAKQDECHTDAEAMIAQMPGAAAMPPDQRGAELVNQFTICMNKAGWKVANPLKPKGAPVTPPPPLDAAKPVAGAAVPPPTPPATAPITPANAATPLPPTPQPAPTAMPAPAQPPAMQAASVPPAPPVNPNGPNVYYPNAEPIAGRQF
jgi:hypothetical protein